MTDTLAGMNGSLLCPLRIARRLACVALIGALAGCPDPDVEYRHTASLSVDVSGCLAATPGARSGCVPAQVPDDGVIGCFVLESAAGERGAASVEWNGATLVTARVDVDVSARGRLSAAVFVFDRAQAGDLDRCLAGRLSASTACGEVAGCVVRLRQEPFTLDGDGGGGVARVDFGRAAGRCNTDWAAEPPAEACDGADQDCDGLVDEGFLGLGEPCEGPEGACGESQVVCAADGMGTTCDRVVPPEICDAADNDCDGEVDEGFAPPCCEPGEIEACNEDPSGVCEVGNRRCQPDGQWGPCVDEAGNPVSGGEDERCDGADNDCDGQVDEGFRLGDNGPQVGAQCFGEGIGACRDTGVVVCSDRMGAACQITMLGADFGQPETCNAIDDDCDGTIDEGSSVACWDEVAEVHRDVGACAPGTRACVGGMHVDECVGEVGPRPEQCQPPDGPQVDEDCDGLVDEARNACGLCGAPPPELCNDFDDDCDGQIDEGFDLGNDASNCGACGRDCAVDDQGDPLNATFRCDTAACVFEACDVGFVDLDCASDNGCECDRGIEEIDFEDDDCDGIVDEGGNSIFVAPSAGGGRGVGSAADPYRSLDDALDGLAAVPVGQEPVRILIEAGEYDLPDGLEVPSGVWLLGGYQYTREDPACDDAPTHRWARVPRADGGRVTVLTGHRVVLRYRDLQGPTVLDNVEVRADDAIAAEQSSAAVLAVGVGEHLTIGHSLLRGGAGGPGRNGSRGADAQESGENGSPGCDGDDPLCAAQGGAGGAPPACARGLMPIEGGLPPARGGDGGDAGQRGDDGGRTSAAQGPALGGLASDAHPRPGGDGLPGADGPHGANGTAGPAAGRQGAPDDQNLLGWQPRGSTDGRDGLPGGGGGGGGGGLSAGAANRGGGGGGGGAGGCPGAGGTQATGGGGSFGLVVRGGTVLLHEVRIEALTGGAGGRGGDGGFGSRGGDGRPGGDPACAPMQMCTGGGRGGNGGQGGCGGNAGGAAGGPSVAVLRLAADPIALVTSTIRFVVGVGAAEAAPNQAALRNASLEMSLGGNGGDGGFADVTCGPAADDGPPGADLPVGCCVGVTCTAQGAPLACPP